MSGERPEEHADAGGAAGKRRIEIKTDDTAPGAPEAAEAEEAAETARGEESNTPEAEADEAVPGHVTVELTHSEYAELKTLARERDEFYRRLQHAVADYQNLQKRVDKFRDAARESILRSLGEAILPVADSLALALDAARQTEGGEKIVEGLKLVEKEFYGALARFGIHPVEAVGRPFDPHFHEALFQEPTDEAEPNTVLRELKRGFVMGHVVLRPSQVIVAGPPAGKGQ
jgi:molecular chaperone GrpE